MDRILHAELLLDVHEVAHELPILRVRKAERAAACRNKSMISSSMLPVSSTGCKEPMIRIPAPDDSGTSFPFSVASDLGRGVTETSGSAGVSSVRPLLRGSLGGGGLCSPDSSSSFVSIPPYSSNCTYTL